MRMSTPTLRIQSGIAIQTSPRGIPEENDMRTTDLVRQAEKARTRLFPMPTRSGACCSSAIEVHPMRGRL